MIERIVITFQPDGKFRGASAQDFDGLPAPLDPAALDAIAPTFNLALQAQIDALITEKATAEADKTVAQTALADIEAAALANPEDLAAIILKARDGRESAIDKEIAALEAQIAAEQARLAELKAKGGEVVPLKN